MGRRLVTWVSPSQDLEATSSYITRVYSIGSQYLYVTAYTHLYKTTVRSHTAEGILEPAHR